MKSFFRFVYYDYKLKWGNIPTIAVFIILPVLMSLTMKAVFIKSEKEKGFEPPRIALVNLDNGFLSRGLVSFLTNEKMKKGFDFETTNYSDGVKGMKAEVYSAMVVIPENFTDNFFKEKSPEILLIKNPSQEIYPDIVEKALSIAIEGSNYVLTYFYPEFKEMAGIYIALKEKSLFKGLSLFRLERLKTLAEDIFNKSKKAFTEARNLPFTVEIKREKKGERKTMTDLMKAIFPASALFFLLFFTNMAAVSIVKDDEKEITKRVILTGVNTSRYLLVKITSAILFLLSLSIFFLLSGYLIFHFKSVSLLTLSGVVFLGIVSLFSPFFLISSVAKNEESASNIGLSLLFIMGFSGGGMIPSNFLPSFILNIAKVFPFYRVNRLIVNTITNQPLGKSDIVFLITLSTICYLTGFVFYRKKFLE